MTEFEAAAAELADAMSGLLDCPEFRRSTEHFASAGIYLTPAQQLRKQADEIDARDAAIERANKALRAYSAAVVKMPFFGAQVGRHPEGEDANAASGAEGE